MLVYFALLIAVKCSREGLLPASARNAYMQYAKMLELLEPWGRTGLGLLAAALLPLLLRRSLARKLEGTERPDRAHFVGINWRLHIELIYCSTVVTLYWG